MIRTVLTLRMGSQDMNDTTFLINNTQIGFLAPSEKRNHVLSSHRHLQLIAGLKSTSDELSLAATQQKENIRLWQRCSRDVQQRGLKILTQAAAYYGLRPDWLIGIDDQYMHAWLLDNYGIFLMRNGELFQVEPISDSQAKMPDNWRAYLHQSTIEIMEGDYYLFLPPDFFNVVTSEEVQKILSGLQQLSVKINELIEIARLRKYDLTDTWMALQIQKIELDAQQPISLIEQWKILRKNKKKPILEDSMRQQTKNSSLRQATHRPNELNFEPENTNQSDDNFDDEKIKLRTDRQSWETETYYDTGQINDDEIPDVIYKKRQPIDSHQKNDTKRDSTNLIDSWLGWSKEKKLLSVIIIFAVIILFAWGINSLFSDNDSKKEDLAQISEDMILPTPTPLPPTVATTVEVTKIRMVVNAQSLNFREIPGTDAPLIKTLPEGSIVTKIGDSEEEGWIKVLLEDGTEAYAYAEYLTETSQENIEETQ